MASLATVRALRPHTLALVAIVLVTLAACLPQVLRHAPFSALDEGAHVDYAWRASHFDIPAPGDTISPEIREIWSCYGQDDGWQPVCDPSLTQAELPAKHAQIHTSHPPTYYLVTGLLGRALSHVPSVDLITGMRLTGMLWMLAGLLLLYRAALECGLGRGVALPVVLLTGTWWTTLAASTVVTNDAPFLLVSASAVLIVARAARGRLGWWLPVLAALLLGTTKIINALALMAVAGVLLLMAIVPRCNPAGLSRTRLAGIAAAMVASVGGAYVAWTRWQSARGDPDYVSPTIGINTEPFEGVPFDEWMTVVFDGFISVGTGRIGSVAANAPVITMLAFGASAAIIGVGFAAIVLGRAGSVLSMLGIALLLGLLAWPMLVELRGYMASGGEHWFPNPSKRYAMSLGPLGFIAMGLVATRMRWVRALQIVAVVVVALTLIAIWAKEPLDTLLA